MPDSATPWAAVHQALLSMRFPRQEYWSGLPFPSPEDLPDPGIKPRFPVLQADSLPTELQGKPTPKPSRKISELGQLNQRNPLPYLRPSQGFMGGTVGSVGWELVVWLQIETHIPKSKSQLHPAPLTEPICASIFSSLKRECNSSSLIGL